MGSQIEHSKDLFRKINHLRLLTDLENSFDTEAPYLDLNLSITNGIVLLKFVINGMILILKKKISHFLIEMFLAPLPIGVYIFQLIRFARVCSKVDEFNNRNLFLTAKLLKQGYR